MPQADPKAVWCLARANEPPCQLSTRELLILAELGKLRGDDVIWRSGTNAKQSIRSMLGRTNGSLKPASSASKHPPKAVIPKPPVFLAEEVTPGETPAMAAKEPAAGEALPMTPAADFEPRGQGRRWALAGALAGVATVSLCLAVVATVFIYANPMEPEAPIDAQSQAPASGPVALSDPAAPPAPVTTDEVAVRKVKVLEIPAPPGQ